MASKVPLQAHGISSDDAKAAIEALKSDMATVGRALNTAAVIPLTGTRVVIPQSGSVVAYVVCDTLTVSTGIAYHIVKVLRSGQTEGRSYDTRNAELPAYQRIYLGTYAVSTGDLLTVSVAVTGAPVPLLSAANICLSCELTPITEA